MTEPMKSKCDESPDNNPNVTTTAPTTTTVHRFGNKKMIIGKEEEEEEEGCDCQVQVQVQALPGRTMALMVHKQFAQRIMDYFQDKASAVSSSSSSETAATVTVTATDRSRSSSSVVIIIDPLPLTSGVSRSRRGYIVLLLLDTSESSGSHCHGRWWWWWSRLSPMARQNMAWIASLSHAMVVPLPLPLPPMKNSSPTNVADDADKILASRIWNELHQHHHFRLSRTTTTTQSTTNMTKTPLSPILQLQQHYLRIDVHPKDQTTRFCLALERHIAEHVLNMSAASSPLPTRPFVDPNIPLIWTKSKRKCTHRIVIIVVNQNDDNDHYDPRNVTSTAPLHLPPTSSITYYFGVESRSSSAPQRVPVPAPEKVDAEAEANADADTIIIHPLPFFLLDVPLNDEANKEIVIVPCDSGSCCCARNSTSSSPMNHDASSIQPHTLAEQVDAISTPLSRAYYKLHEVWTDHLSRNNNNSNCQAQLWFSSILQATTTTSSTTAIDVGACPGGWTQVLLEMGYTHIVPIDPGHIASALTEHPFVSFQNCHVQNVNVSQALSIELPGGVEMPHHSPRLRPTCSEIMDDEEECGNELDTRIPPKRRRTMQRRISTWVCDASLTYAEMLDLTLTTVTQWTTRTATAGGKEESLLFSLPSLWVLTLKLPFKTPQSILRHVNRIREVLPTFVAQLAAVLYPDHSFANTNNSTSTKREEVRKKVVAEYRIIHLFANSDSERTLLLMFHQP